MVNYRGFYGVIGMEDNKIYLSKSGYEQYLKELQELRDYLTSNGKSKSDAYSGAVGDGWHDNFAFEEAKREELRIQNLINQKVNQLKNIVIVEDSQDASLIEIDDYIDVEMTYEDEEPERMIFKLVGSNTPDIKKEIPQISLNSPLGKSVYGKRKGDITSYQVNNLIVNVHINNKAKSLDELQKVESKKELK